jgi:site-specific recombinase XerD
MNKERIPLTQLAATFEVYNKTVGKSAHTVAWYNNRLALFAGFVGDGCSLSDITADRVREFIVYLQERTEKHQNNPYMRSELGKLSSAYIQGCVRALRAFASWLHAENYTDTNRLKSVKPPKVQGKVVQVLADDEI